MTVNNAMSELVSNRHCGVMDGQDLSLFIVSCYLRLQLDLKNILISRFSFVLSWKRPHISTDASNCQFGGKGNAALKECSTFWSDDDSFTFFCVLRGLLHRKDINNLKFFFSSDSIRS